MAMCYERNDDLWSSVTPEWALELAYFLETADWACLSLHALLYCLQNIMNLSTTDTAWNADNTSTVPCHVYQPVGQPVRKILYVTMLQILFLCGLTRSLHLLHFPLCLHRCLLICKRQSYMNEKYSLYRFILLLNSRGPTWHRNGWREREKYSPEREIEEERKK